ncbi:PARVA-like protein [Mya arenaria]|uniref:PARVA-like protein n=1 Tax=Mya arenaria TaxID=6604 RepID=A0ABY7EIA7_MYAAR|nr:PARVA-like protein [Mya arenaria]
MATSPNTSTLSKKKDESFLEKIGTLGRKKKTKEALELQEEGKNAIESPTKKLAKIKVEVPEVSQSEQGQKQKLRVILEVINNILNLPQLGTWNQQKWSVDSVHSKNLVAILHLLVALVRHFRAPIRLPENVQVFLVVVQKREGMLQPRKVAEDITGTNEDVGGKFERDAFDTLFDHAPDKLNLVKKTLVTFVNKQLMKVNLEVQDIHSQKKCSFNVVKLAEKKA